MANSDFYNGLINVRGTLSKKVSFANGQKIVTRVVASVRNGKQRIYIRRDTPRTKEFSLAERRSQQRMALAAKRYATLTNHELKAFADNYKRDAGIYNGKKYATLRGFIIAWLIAHIKDIQSKQA